MGKTLRPVPQVKSHINNLLDSVDDRFAITWKEKHTKKKNFDDWKHEAEQERPLSLNQMKELMMLCWEGNPELGIKRDFRVAFKMAEKLDAEGDIVGKAYFGEMLCKEPFCEVLRGLTCLGFAAGKGSDVAAFYLAEYFMRPPLKDLEIDVEQALIHYQLSLSLAQDDSNSNRSMTAKQLAFAKFQVDDLDETLSSSDSED